ncbi:hypothetical protein JCM14469_03870 [Desulfatiferula olefinivorans]
MESLFEDVFSIEGVLGILVITEEGASEYTKLVSPLAERVGDKSFSSFIKNSINLEALRLAFDQSLESLIIYEKLRLYVRKTQSGYLIVVMGMFVPVAMVRMNCQIIIPELDKMKKSKGLGRFFKK